ncbi:MAG: TonB-dependent receptor [Bacteroidota bacterium]
MIGKLFIVLFIMCSFSYSGSGILEGRITDKNSGDGLPSAVVRIVDSKIGTVTDEEGYFTIRGLQSGNYDIEVSLVGYRKVLYKKVEILSLHPTRLDVHLEPSAIDLQTVEIIAHKELIQRDVPSTAYAISSIKLEQLPVTSVQDVLALQPGITVEGNVRGGKTQEVLYLIDGMPLQDLMKGGSSGDIPKSAISEINIYTGGFDVEYGNALSGVVNIMTKSGENRFISGARFEKDDWFAYDWNKQISKWSEMEAYSRGPILKDQLYYFTAHTVRLTDGEYWQDAGVFFPSPISTEYMGIGKIDVVSGQNSRLSFHTIYNYAQWRDYEFTWRYNLSGLPKREKNTVRLGLLYTDTPIKNLTYTIQLGYSLLHNHIGDDSKTMTAISPYQYDIYLRYIVRGTRNWWADSKQKVYTAKAILTYEVNKLHYLKIGGDINQYDIFSDLLKYEPTLSYFGKPIETAPLLNYSNQYHYLPLSGSVFAQDKIEFQRDGAIFSAGFRYDFHDSKAERPVVEFIPTRSNEFTQKVASKLPSSLKQQFSLRTSFSVPTGPSSIFFINFGQFFQMPLFDYLYSGINPVQLRGLSKNVLSGNPDLLPERTDAWEIGFKQLLQNNYVISFTFFKKLTSNQVDSKTLVPFDSKFAGDYGFASYVNNAQARAQGVEIVFMRESDEQFTNSVSYTYMVARGISETADQSINYAQWGFAVAPVDHYLSWDQRHTIKVDVNAKLFWGISANATAIFNSPRPYTQYPTRDGFTPVDPTKEFIPNNVRMKSTIFSNIKVTKTFEIDDLFPSKVTVYIDSRNLLNYQNVKWYDSNGKIGGELGDPTAYYSPRRTRIGLLWEF